MVCVEGLILPTHVPKGDKESHVITVLFPSKDIQGMVFPCFDCIIVSVIYCSVAINPKFSGLNNIYYLTVPVEQEFRSDLAALAPAWSFL